MPSEMIISPSADRPETRLATRLSFFAAGFGIACWAPLVPFAKANVGVDDRGLGLLLLCLGMGSLVSMPIAGWISARAGAKPMILAGGFGLVFFLPILAVAQTPISLALTLLLFGASLGAIDVAVNVHAVEVERSSDRPLMSGFHALFSVGGFVGAGGMTLLFVMGLSPLAAALISSALTVTTLLLALPRLLQAKGGEAASLALPRGIVLLLAVLAAITFLVEGAILDWSALLLTEKGFVTETQGGLGYMIFAIAMLTGRFTGDWVVRRLGGRRILFFGGLMTLAGFCVLLLAPWTPAALSGFLLIGFGAANIVPVLCSQAGRQKVMPAGMAIAAVTTCGYAGILIGPAAIGFLSHATSLPGSFWLLATLVLALPLSARAATRD